MRKESDNKKKYFKYCLIGVLVVLLISASLMLLDGWEKRQGLFPSHEIKEDFLLYNGQEYALKKNIETFLVIGLDKFEGVSSSDSYNNDQQSDFLLLLVFDNDEKRINAIHINRDTMANVNILGVAGNKIDTVKKQIALAHTYGNGRDVSCRNTADAVSDLLKGIRVNHYISFAMDSVAVLNDLVGGVEVTVTEDFTGIDEALVKGEKVTLMGEQALHYVRTRYGLEDSSNSTRMKRQQQYINALYEKYTQCVENDDSFVVESSIAMSDYIVSDRSVTQLQDLLKKFMEYDFIGIDDFEGKGAMGEKFAEFYADEDSIMSLVVELFYELKK